MKLLQEQEGVVPDIQAIGKCLGAGYAPISAILVNHNIIDTLKGGSGYFAHGQTYQSLPISCAAALEVQKIVQEQDLIGNVARMGKYLERTLRDRLEHHPHVGDIRGRGLFWAVEFVADKVTKAPFDAKMNVAKRLGSKGLEEGYDISLFVATGAADGWLGDHFLLAPPFTVGEADVREIVTRVVRVVDSVFEDLEREGLLGEKKRSMKSYSNGSEKKIANASGPDDAVSNGVNGHSNGISGHSSSYKS